MTLNELSQLYYLNKEIKQYEDRLYVLRSRAGGLAGKKFSQLPGGRNGESNIERYIHDINELNKLIVEKRNCCIKEELKLERYIAEIADSLTRMVFTLRFVKFLSWKQVAVKVGGGNTEESVKKVCYRYLSKKESTPR